LDGRSAPMADSLLGQKQGYPETASGPRPARDLLCAAGRVRLFVNAENDTDGRADRPRPASNALLLALRPLLSTDVGLAPDPSFLCVFECYQLSSDAVTCGPFATSSAKTWESKTCYSHEPDIHREKSLSRFRLSLKKILARRIKPSLRAVLADFFQRIRGVASAALAAKHRCGSESFSTHNPCLPLHRDTAPSPSPKV
jgi:hypothetical protein